VPNLENKFRLFCFLFIALLLLSNLNSVTLGVESMSDVHLKLGYAKAEFNQVFNAVLRAEKNGSNVTQLLYDLNNVAEILMNSENNFLIGNLNETIFYADNTIYMAHKIYTLVEDTENGSKFSFHYELTSKISFTLLGIIVYFFVLFIIWCCFKRSYINNLLKSKPMANTNES